jgi:AcrR family transcriptional regulator
MRTRKSADERKAEVVEAAMRLAAELGPERVTTERLARAVQLTQPAIFRHFPTKDAIWLAVAEAIGSRLETRWQAAAHGPTASGRLHRLVMAQLGLIRSVPAIPAILFSRELHARNEHLRAAFHGLLEKLHRLLAEAIDDGRRQGEFPSDLDPSDAAYLIVALIQGLAVRWSLSGRRFDLIAEGERLLKIQLQGFGGTFGEEPAR